MSKIISNRRRFLGQLGAGASLVTFGGCDIFDGMLGTGDPVLNFLRKANVLTKDVQRAIQGPMPMAPEYPASAIREAQRPNGSTNPQTADYLAVKKNGFAGYRLQVFGCKSQGLSTSRYRSASMNCTRCLRAPRSRGTIASRAGAASPNGRACSCRTSSTRRGSSRLRATSSSAVMMR